MFTQATFLKARDESCKQTAAVLRRLKKMQSPTIEKLTIAVGDLKPTHASRLKSLLEKVPSGRTRANGGESDFIYVIDVGKGSGGVVAKLRKDLMRARAAGSDYPRINEEAGATGALYVGRTCTLRSRLGQHLGSGHGGTYALHLGRWATAANCTLEISYFELRNSSNLLVQAIEDGIWQRLQPAFGRQGAR